MNVSALFAMNTYIWSRAAGLGKHLTQFCLLNLGFRPSHLNFSAVFPRPSTARFEDGFSRQAEELERTRELVGEGQYTTG